MQTTYIEILLSIVLFVGTLLATVVFIDRKDKASLYFSISACFTATWVASMIGFYFFTDRNILIVPTKLLYITGIFITQFLFYFSFYFLRKDNLPLPKRTLYTTSISTLVVVLLIAFSNLIISGVDFQEETRVVLFGPLFILFLILLFWFFYAAYRELFRHLKAALLENNRTEKTQLLYVMIGIGISVMAAVVCNIFLPMFGNFEYFWVGPFLNIAYVSAATYAIFRHHLFNIKIIFVEAALLLFNFTFFVNIFFSHGNVGFAVNVFMFVGVLLFSIFLVRGIYKEIRYRERIEKLVNDTEVANEHLRVMEEQKTEFVSIVSHQLRTPITVIKGYASMILEGTFGPTNDTARDIVEKLYKLSEKIIALVEGLLTVSRIEQGKMTFNFEDVNFKEFLEGVLSRMKDDINKSKLTLSFVAEGGKTFHTSLDKKKFGQVVQHILGNAFEYTKAPGKIRVILDEDEVANKIRFVVSDTGKGMTQKQINAVFEQFNLKSYRNGGPDISELPAMNEKEIMKRETQKKASSGEGHAHPSIGLYIAQEIIDAHYGIMRIESAGINRGTTVIVEIPKVADNQH